MLMIMMLYYDDAYVMDAVFLYGFYMLWICYVYAMMFLILWMHL